MKKIIGIFAVVLLFSGMNAFAKEGSNDIAVVDIQRVLQDANAAKDIRDQIKVLRDKYQADISKEEEDLRKAEQKLTEQKSILSQDAFKDKREEFKNKLNKAQRDVQEKRTQLDASLNDSIGQVQKVVFDIISEIAKEKGFKLAVPTSQILYSEDSMNITDEVLQRLNKKLPTVKVKTDVKPAAASAAGKKKEDKKAKDEKAQ
ncbi:MAG: outer membrane protein [Rickettsiaceae bacterium]|jgi:Skp family chaperone for outer membrane proteins|nr:outer membrane protein [Rickettsiaceae bacterium]